MNHEDNPAIDPAQGKYPFYVRPSLDFVPFVEFEPEMSENYLKNLIYLNEVKKLDPLLLNYIQILERADRQNVIEQTKEESQREYKRVNILIKYAD